MTFDWSGLLEDSRLGHCQFQSRRINAAFRGRKMLLRGRFQSKNIYSFDTVKPFVINFHTGAEHKQQYAPDRTGGKGFL